MICDSIMHYSIQRCSQFHLSFDLFFLNQALLCTYLLNKAELTIS